MEDYSKEEISILSDLVALESEATMWSLGDDLSRSKLAYKDVPTRKDMEDRVVRLKVLRMLENKLFRHYKRLVDGRQGEKEE